ncbi:hypothetical protein ATANTOWER_012967 [Ataeniobius toweri]|uniref:Uncharacterized protein n=1 Tax=Ataeniobius toweri TaxID=208326 RepID=A0ABU7BID1_9TELE|nr:hypothetical protein [Ataeniobius toweri]
MALDSEELIFIPAASHSAANHPSACCRSWLEGACRTTSSAKTKDEIQWSPNQPPSSPQLHLKILIMEIMNRTGDKRAALPESNMHWEQVRLSSANAEQTPAPPTLI